MTTSNYKNNQVHDSGNSNSSNNDILNYNAVHLAYNIDKITRDTLDNKDEKYLSELDGWQQVCHSRISNEMSEYNLRAVVFVNKSKNALHFAFAGTDPGSYHDLVDDIKVYRQQMINKFIPMQSLINKVDKVIGAEEVAKYRISSSGHSLGAVVSDLLAAEMLSQGRKFTKSTTFDSPGSKPIVEEAIKNNLLTCSKELCINDVAKHCTTFLAKPNFINSTNAQLADDIRLIVPNNAEDEHDIKQKEYDNGELGWASFLYNKVGTACNAVADVLGINKVISDVNGHKLLNFKNYMNSSYRLDQWIEYNKNTGHDNPTPVISAEDNPGLVSKLKNTQPSSKDILLTSQEGDYTKVDWMDYDQLAKENNGYSTGDENDCQKYVAEPNHQELAGQLPEVDMSII